MRWFGHKKSKEKPKKIKNLFRKQRGLNLRSWRRSRDSAAADSDLSDNESIDLPPPREVNPKMSHESSQIASFFHSLAQALNTSNASSCIPRSNIKSAYVEAIASAIDNNVKQSGGFTWHQLIQILKNTTVIACQRRRFGFGFETRAGRTMLSLLNSPENYYIKAMVIPGITMEQQLSYADLYEFMDVNKRLMASKFHQDTINLYQLHDRNEATMIENLIDENKIGDIHRDRSLKI